MSVIQNDVLHTYQCCSMFLPAYILRQHGGVRVVHLISFFCVVFFAFFVVVLCVSNVACLFSIAPLPFSNVYCSCWQCNDNKNDIAECEQHSKRSRHLCRILVTLLRLCESHTFLSLYNATFLAGNTNVLVFGLT